MDDAGNRESDQPRPTQQTQPKKGEPIEIPVPKREDFDKLIRRAAKAKTPAPKNG